MNQSPETDEELMLFDIYEPTFEIDEEVSLAAYHWQFYARIDGVSTGLQICQDLEFPTKAATSALLGLLQANAIRKRLWTYSEFFPASTALDPENASDNSDTNHSETEVKTYLLKDVIDFIRSRSSSDMEGKLMVYRVFLQIPPELLEAEGVTSFDLNSNHIEVKDEKLLDAISQATSNIVGVPYSWD